MENMAGVSVNRMKNNLVGYPNGLMVGVLVCEYPIRITLALNCSRVVSSLVDVEPQS